MKERIDNKNEDSLDEKLSELSRLISSVWNKIPEDDKPKERKPTIIICGQTGVGKSTTINTLFGENVAKIGYFSRGTANDEVYEWVSDSENINVIDLPGLGDGDTKKEKEFRDIYRKRVKEADAIIIVSTPPRPASVGTIKTINLLLSEGVRSSHIVFGLNKLTHLEYPLANGLSKIEIDGLIGPTKESDFDAIEEQKKAFLEDLNTYVRSGKFNIEQIVEFDSKTGWNLHKMLFACVDRIPFVVARRFRLASLEGEREAKKREKKKLEDEKKRLEEMVKLKEAQIKQQESEKDILEREINGRIFDQQDTIEDLKRKNEKLTEKIEKREEKLREYEKNERRLNTTVIGKIANGVANIVEKYDKTTASVIRETTRFIEKGYDKVKKGVKNIWNKIKFW